MRIRQLLRSGGSSKGGDDLAAQAVVGLQVHQHVREVEAARVELPDHVGPDVRGRGQDPEQLGPSPWWNPGEGHWASSIP